MGTKLFKFALGVVLCFSMMPAFQTDIAWGVESDTQGEARTEKATSTDMGEKPKEDVSSEEGLSNDEDAMFEEDDQITDDGATQDELQSPDIIDISDTAEGEELSIQENVAPTLKVRAHSAQVGWQAWAAEAETAGTTGRALRLEALQFQLITSDYTGSIEYRAHVQRVGWQGWETDGATAGTTGQSLRIEAVQIGLTGDLADAYDVYYRMHVAGLGWLGWAKNGISAGITGYSLRTEAIQVQLVEKDGAAPSSSLHSTVSLSYSSQGHSSVLGWLATGTGSRVVGTTGKKRALEGVKFEVNSSISGGIQYQSHVSHVGWQSWQDDGALSGTTGEKKKIEAVKIRLTGDLSTYFDVYYRAHVSGYGWLGWGKNGALAGTSKNGIAMEAVQIKIVVKKAAAPGSTKGSYWETPPLPQSYRAMNAKVKNLSSPTKWLIAIDSTNCLVGVYQGSKGRWTNKYMWKCSPGTYATPTVKGIYSVGSRGYVFGAGYSCYWWTQFYGDYLFHSVLYYPGTDRIMEGVLGVRASHGCVRLNIKHARWIHDTIPSGTTVLSY